VNNKQNLINEALAAERQARWGQQLQQTSLAILNSIPMVDAKHVNMDDFDFAGLAKLVREATTAMSEGVSIETKALEKLTKLSGVVEW
jgi:hypothetical protein